MNLTRLKIKLPINYSLNMNMYKKDLALNNHVGLISH